MTIKRNIGSGLFTSVFCKYYFKKLKFLLNRYFHEKIVFKLGSKESVFTSIYRNNYWGNAESLSGIGSTLLQTTELRQNLPLLFIKYKINSVFDAPCGDMNWMKEVLKDQNVNYLGGDIVADIIKENKKRIKLNTVNFIQFDITSDNFPDADIWICRATLYHLSNKEIFLALNKFINSNIKYILTTNCVTDENHINTDIKTGDWRSLNLLLPPFNFPRDPLWEINDFVEPHPPLKITLWSREQIKYAMSNTKN